MECVREARKWFDLIHPACQTDTARVRVSWTPEQLSAHGPRHGLGRTRRQPLADPRLAMLEVPARARMLPAQKRSPHAAVDGRLIRKANRLGAAS